MIGRLRQGGVSVPLIVGEYVVRLVNDFPLWRIQATTIPPIAWYVIPPAMLVLWVVGQAAVFGPARRPSRVSPALATRSI